MSNRKLPIEKSNALRLKRDHRHELDRRVELALIEGLEIVEARAESEVAAERRILRQRIADQDLEAIVGAVGAQAQARVAARLVLRDRLIVVVDGRAGDCQRRAPRAPA